MGRIIQGAGVLLLLFFLAVFLQAGCGVVPPPPRPVRIRVLSYNIRHGLGMEGGMDLDGQARVIRRAAPDLVALQEVDEGTRRSLGIREAGLLGRKTGLHGVFGKAMDFDGGGYGEGILSRFPLLRVIRHPLPAAKGYEPRALLEVRVRPAGSGPGIVFFGTHLDHLSQAQRVAQAKEINRVAAALGDRPMILAGDLNARPGGRAMKEFFKLWTPADRRRRPTFPADKPGRKIDWILFRPARRWRVLEFKVLDEPEASDHRPLLAVLELLPPDGSRSGGKD